MESKNMKIMKKVHIFLLISLLSCSACSVLHLTPSKKISALSFEQNKRNAAYYFVYPDTKTDTNLIRLREKYHLDEVVKNAKTEHEKVLMMLNWVRNRWEHNGWHDAETNNACTILDRAEKGEKFRCVEYGIVLKNALLAVGLPARQLGLMTRDVEVTKMGAGHVLSEVWLNDKQKWAMVDAQFNTMPMIDDLPLNAVELQKAIIDKKNYRFVNIDGDVSAKEHKNYMKFIPHYLYYFSTSLDHRTLPLAARMKVEGNDGIGLKPIGAKTPTVFQRKYPITGDYYTNSVADFYAAPR
jgi:Transglutaminase-like superfamily